MILYKTTKTLQAGGRKGGFVNCPPGTVGQLVVHNPGGCSKIYKRHIFRLLDGRELWLTVGFACHSMRPLTDLEILALEGQAA
jgi:hypothetical protein